jgi:hypothetical protein
MPGDTPVWRERRGRSPPSADRRAGADVLRDGGIAVEAAVAWLLI